MSRAAPRHHRTPQLLALALAASACKSIPEGGHFVEPGFAEGEVKPGDEVWARFYDDDYELVRRVGFDANARPVVVESITGDRVRFRHGAEVSRGDVVPTARVRPGAVVVRPDNRWQGCAELLAVRTVTGNGTAGDQLVFTCGGADHMVWANEVKLVDRRWVSFRRKRWSWIAGALLVALGLPLLLARALRRAERDRVEARTEGAAHEARAEAMSAPIGRRVVEPLACANCGAAVPLAPGATVACRHCRAPVPVPGVYAQLVEVRAGLREALARQAEALAAHRRARSPWLAAPMLVGAGVCYLFASLHAASSGVELAQFVAGAAAVGLVVGALGQATGGGAALDVAVASFAARRIAGGGYDCRTCGGPLATVEDGAAELCAYCGAQNLLVADAARAARRDAAHATAAGHSVAALLADARAARLEALRVPVQAIAAMAGVIALVGVIAMSL